MLDLIPFGVYTVKSAMLTADASSDLVYRISFDAGRTFRVVDLHDRFTPTNSTGRIIVEIQFPVSGQSDEQLFDAAGVFPLQLGTIVTFTDGKHSYNTTVGFDGRYSVSLPPGTYTVSYMQSGKRVTLIDKYNPEAYVFRQQDDLDKENTIEQFMSKIAWATHAVYDTFKDASKMSPMSTAKINLTHSLVSSGKCVRYWALVFET